MKSEVEEQSTAGMRSVAVEDLIASGLNLGARGMVVEDLYALELAHGILKNAVDTVELVPFGAILWLIRPPVRRGCH